MRLGSSPGADGDLVVGGHALERVRLDVLHAFLVVAEELHFTRYAARLFLNQSALSRRIDLLEPTIRRRCCAGRGGRCG